jgi:hypothetical protein
VKVDQKQIGMSISGHDFLLHMSVQSMLNLTDFHNRKVYY